MESKDNASNKAKRRQQKAKQARKNAFMELNKEGRMIFDAEQLKGTQNCSNVKLPANFQSTSSVRSSTANETNALFETNSSSCEKVSKFAANASDTPRSTSSINSSASGESSKAASRKKKTSPQSSSQSSSYIFQNYQVNDSSDHSADMASGDLAKTSNQQMTSRLAAEAKLTSIMSYLDQVESKTPKVNLHDAENRLNRIGSIEEQSTQITQEMLKLKLDFEEKKKNVDLLERALADQKTTMDKKSELHTEDLNRQLNMQKQQYEATIQRHLTFIDQLIDDKKVLNHKCEEFVKELKTVDEKYQRKIKVITDNHKVEAKKVKENIAASEKLFREQWVKEKTNRIKEMTVKGLEPEIQRLISKHKDEVELINTKHKSEIAQVQGSLNIKMSEWKESFRRQMEVEKETACRREVEITKERYERQLEEAEMSFQAQKRKIYEELQREKEEMKQWSIKKESEVERVKVELRGTSEISASQFRSEFERRAQEIRLEYEEEITRLKRKLEAEKSSWQQSFIKNQEAVTQQREREARDLMRAERDREIGMVVRKVEEEMEEQRGELERSCENRIRRVKSKYEVEVGECEKSEREAQEKYLALKTTVNELNDENSRLKSLIKSKNIEMEELNERNEKLSGERSNVSEIVRKEFADQIDFLQDELKNYKENLTKAKSEWRSEVDDLKTTQANELSTVDERVREMMEKKDEAITQFRMKCEAATKRADHLEEMFEQQRRRLLGAAVPATTNTSCKKKK